MSKPLTEKDGSGGKKRVTTELLSQRAQTVVEWEDFLLKYLLLCNSNEYNEETNVEGYVNLGTGVNNLCNDLIMEKMNKVGMWQFRPDLQHYDHGHGLLSLRESLARFMTIMFESQFPIDPEDLFCVTGVTSCLDIIAHCLADPGDVILTPTPVYGRILTDFKQRSLVEVWPIPLCEENGHDTSFQLTLAKVEEAYNRAKETKTVRGLLLINPHNPLGEVYSSELVMDILKFCHKHQLHAIVDEIYGLSIFNEGVTFHSIFNASSLPDPLRTHVLYGLSKDFAIGGMRIGAIHTKNEALQRVLIQLSFFQHIPLPIMDMTCRILDDIDWCKRYVMVNRKRMAEKFSYCKQRLEEMGLNVYPSSAGIFLWVDFRKFCHPLTYEMEVSLFETLIKEAFLYIVPGKELFCPQPGWMRICFAGRPNHIKEGLDRLEVFLKRLSTSPEVLHRKCNFEHKDSEAGFSDTDGISTFRDNNEESLEDLVLLLRKQMKKSNWLSECTTQANNPVVSTDSGPSRGKQE